MSVEVAAGDVAKVILQFCRENGLVRSVETLQAEAQVYLNTVDNVDALEEDVESGQWDAVLKTLSGLHLPQALVIDIFEQILLELVELRELEPARNLLRTSSSFVVLRKTDADRYLTLEKLISSSAVDPSKNVYAVTTGASKQSRRSAIARGIREHVTTVAPSRLLALLGQSLKFQHAQGLLPPGTKFDLLRNRIPSVSSEADAPSVSRHTTIRFGSKSHAECACFSPIDDYLVTGSSDGFVEVWDYLSGKLRTDLKYQADEDLMSHEGAVTCMAFSREGELLATGSVDKKVKVWRIRSGKVLRRFELMKAPTCVEFSRDGSQVLVGFPDGVLRLMGMKSGKLLKEFHGHSSSVNDVVFIGDGSTMLSASGDGTMRLWSVKSCQTLKLIRPANFREGSAVFRIIVMPDDPEKVLVCGRSVHVQIMTLAGGVTKLMTSKVGLVDAAVSAKGNFVYALGEDGIFRVFEIAGSTEPVKEIKADEKGAIGVVHHPMRNVLAVFGTSGQVSVFRP